MLAHSIFFYFFSIIAIFSSLMVITSRNTVNSVFFLILDFISVGCLFIMVGAEFLGMIILIVYVGAVAVLFLFLLFALIKAIVPRYRYDQLMRLGWKIFLPLSLLYLVLTASFLFYFDKLPKGNF